jgi:uncharacterized protein YbaR (Trm112 family)
MVNKKLQEILVCPQCKGSLASAEGGKALCCKACQLKYPVRDGIPVMLVDEAIDIRSGKHAQNSLCRGDVAAFKVIDGPNKGLAFHLDRLTCKAIGRSMADPNKTTIFNIDVSLALDEGTKGLIQHYISRQFKDPKAANNEVTGSFKRTSDVVLDDLSISRLHAMVFYGEAGVGVLDMVSKNGTFVNGEEIESRLLKKGDAIEIGETKIIFEG